MKVAIINLTKFVEEIEAEKQDVSRVHKHNRNYQAGINEGLRLAGIIVEESILPTPPMISEAK